MWQIILPLAVVSGVGTAEVDQATVSGWKATDELALEFRLATYEAYRTERPRYDQQISIGNELLRIAQELPSDAPDQQRLGDWFRNAALATKTGAPLPTKPVIDLTQYASQTWSSPDPPTRENNRPASDFQPRSNIHGDAETAEVTKQTPRPTLPAGLPGPSEGESVDTDAPVRPKSNGFSFGSLGNLLRGKSTGASSAEANGPAEIATEPQAELQNSEWDAQID